MCKGKRRRKCYPSNQHVCPHGRWEMCLPLHNHRSTVLVSCSVVCNADSADCCCLCWMLEHFVSRMDNSGLTNELQEETDHPSDQQEKREKEKNVIKRNFCVSSGFVPSCGQVSLYIYIQKTRRVQEYYSLRGHTNQSKEYDSRGTHVKTPAASHGIIFGHREKERARLFHFLLLIRLLCSWMLLLCACTNLDCACGKKKRVRKKSPFPNIRILYVDTYIHTVCVCV